MTTTPRPSWAHRFGERAGHIWRWLVRQDRRAVDWLTTQGLSAGAARAVSWALKLLVLGVLLCAAFWLTLVAAFVFAGAWLVGSADDTADDKPQWRNGLSGYGLYRGDVRIDPGTADDE